MEMRTIGQIDLETRLGMTCAEIRRRVLSMDNGERWRYMRENRISGGLISLAPHQYPTRPTEAGEGEQITIDEWLGREARA